MSWSLFGLAETLRLNPPIIVIWRTADVDFKYKDYVIPKGTLVTVSPAAYPLIPNSVQPSFLFILSFSLVLLLLPFSFLLANVSDFSLSVLYPSWTHWAVEQSSLICFWAHLLIAESTRFISSRILHVFLPSYRLLWVNSIPYRAVVGVHGWQGGLRPWPLLRWARRGPQGTPSSLYAFRAPLSPFILPPLYYNSGISVVHYLVVSFYMRIVSPIFFGLFHLHFYQCECSNRSSLLCSLILSWYFAFILQELYSFFPFSAGRHACIGEKFAYLQVKTIFSILLRTFELEVYLVSSLSTSPDLRPLSLFLTSSSSRFSSLFPPPLSSPFLSASARGHQEGLPRGQHLTPCRPCRTHPPQVHPQEILSYSPPPSSFSLPLLFSRKKTMWEGEGKIKRVEQRKDVRFY